MGLPITGITLPLLLPQLLSTTLSISSLFLPHLLSTALSVSLLVLPHRLPMALPISLLTRPDPFPIGFIVLPVFLPYALEMLLSVTPVGLHPLGSMRFPVAPVGLRPRGSMRCLVAPVGLHPRGLMRCLVAPVGRRPPGSWARLGGWPFVIIAFVVRDGGSAGAQLSFGRPGAQGSMRWLVAPVSFPPTPGSLGRLEGCPFGLGSAFLALVGGSAGTQFSCGTHRERVAVLVEGCLAV